MSPLRRAAEDMRNVYANEIAAAVAAGRTPDPMSVESWQKYDTELRSLQDAPIV